MKKISGGTYTGERALFSLSDTYIENAIFNDGESPLKESKNLDIYKTRFEWKYPLWYCSHVKVNDSVLTETARSGIWYTDDIEITNSVIDAPKTFRRASNIKLSNVSILNAQETLWNCKNILMKDVKVKGDYLGFNSENVEIDNLYLDGNYAFDGGKNIVIKNSTLISKDTFWNAENVTLINCKIIGEYFSWNSKNITLINCEVESNQGFCYMKNVKLVDCILKNTFLCFEFCEDIDATILNEVDSIKNPTSGVIRVKGVKELILEDEFCDKEKTKIIIS